MLSENKKTELRKMLGPGERVEGHLARLQVTREPFNIGNRVDSFWPSLMRYTAFRKASADATWFNSTSRDRTLFSAGGAIAAISRRLALILGILCRFLATSVATPRAIGRV